MPSACPVCRNDQPQPVAEFPLVPVLCNQLFEDADAARAAPRGRISLSVCPGCGMIWNSAFDASLMRYGAGYENALHHSPSFREFADGLIRRLVDRHDLAGGTVVEIGCGDGYMLDKFARHGVARAIGFDPSMDGIETEYDRRDGVEIVPRYFEAGALEGDIDLIVCRHVLEHIEEPLVFLRSIRRALGDRNTAVYFEVPNTSWLLSAPSPWDVIYEHAGYWTAQSITSAFRLAGFTDVTTETGYGGQFLSVEASPGPDIGNPEVEDAGDVLALARDFSNHFSEMLASWDRKLASRDGRIAIWGAGSKGITFANIVSGTGHGIDALIDLNPKKHGRFIPGPGVPVLPPNRLPDLDPSLVLISNGLYLNEIEKQLAEMGLSPRIDVISD